MFNEYMMLIEHNCNDINTCYLIFNVMFLKYSVIFSTPNDKTWNFKKSVYDGFIAITSSSFYCIFHKTLNDLFPFSSAKKECQFNTFPNLRGKLWMVQVCLHAKNRFLYFDFLVQLT